MMCILECLQPTTGVVLIKNKSTSLCIYCVCCTISEVYGIFHSVCILHRVHIHTVGSKSLQLHCKLAIKRLYISTLT